MFFDISEQIFKMISHLQNWNNDSDSITLLNIGKLLYSTITFGEVIVDLN